MSNNYEDGGVYYDPDKNLFNNDEDGGIYFNPEDQVLIEKHLLPKLETYLQHKQHKSENEECEDFIEMKNVYDKEPWLLDHINHPLFKKNEWFYFVTRTQVSVKNIGRGRNSKRRINGDNDGGSWKLNAKKYIKDEETKEVIGKKQTLKFIRSDNNKKKQKRGDGTSVVVPGSNSSWIMHEEKQTLKFTKSDNNKKKQKKGDGTSVVVPGSNSSWIMHEYSLPEENSFQELVLCKIRKISNSKDEEIETMEVTHDAEEDWIGDFFDRFARTGLDDLQITKKDDQQEPPIYSRSQSGYPPARLGNKSLPI
ncbi:hypothetical protein Bca52824_022472 [Brassica carinata]|uniref:NAC domain-containing protein n=1 Tax=Brassica carinata TaxID=52824 RepID=A0A8X8ART2_BRACI|nr:hypothetical protein Bca52824_022472 [Brassica carinata]